MADPTGGIGKASAQMMQEMQKEMSKVQEQNGPQKAGFNDVMAQQGVNDPTKVQELQKVQEAQKVGQTPQTADVMRTAQSQQVNGVDKSIGVKPVEGAAKTETGLKAVLNQVVQGQGKLDQIIKMATSGKQYGNQELLAIQAAVYKFSQELELTSKVVEKATSGVKQTMQTQV
jgi:hypothetical protein